jgi:hypothetical protein
MKSSLAELIATPQFDSESWKLRLERAPLSAIEQSNNTQPWNRQGHGAEVVRLVVAICRSFKIGRILENWKRRIKRRSVTPTPSTSNRPPLTGRSALMCR